MPSGLSRNLSRIYYQTSLLWRHSHYLMCKPLGHMEIPFKQLKKNNPARSGLTQISCDFEKIKKTKREEGVRDLGVFIFVLFLV